MALLKVREVARELSVTPAAVYQLAARGVLKAVRVGRAVRIEDAAVRAFIASGGTQHERSA
jgi:excisionase family DNA binding protein